MTDIKKVDDEVPGIPHIDRLIHEPARLVIMAHLYVVESADYLFLKRQTGMTWGNLSSHMSKLEEAGYIEVEKEFVGKKPNTSVHLTDKGRSTFEKYRENMKQVFDDHLSKHYDKDDVTKAADDLNIETFGLGSAWKKMSGTVTKNLYRYGHAISINDLNPLVADLQSRQIPLIWLICVLFLSMGMRNYWRFK